jgi:hypothetical protein
MLTSSKERKRTRDEQREADRRLKIEWKDKLWLAERHPVDDAVIAWLCENRAEASKVGLYQWNLEILPKLIGVQTRMRDPGSFQQYLDEVAEQQQAAANIPQFPQDPPKKRRAHAGKRQPSRKGARK